MGAAGPPRLIAWRTEATLDAIAEHRTRIRRQIERDMGKYVFVSHADEDVMIADAACRGLEMAGLDCWIALRDATPDDADRNGVLRALQDSRAMVLLFSSHALRSEPVLQDLGAAFDCGLPVVCF